MAKASENMAARSFPWRIIGWGTAALLMLLPLVANAPWTVSDFVFAGVMFGSVGLAFELIVRQSHSLAYRLAAALAVVSAFLVVWVNAAVGMIGSEDNPFNLLFGSVLLVALIGAIIARFRPAGMAGAMLAAGIAHAMVGVIGLSMDTRGGVLSIAMAALWLLAAALFHNAAREQAALRA